ncbi:MAG TPA: acyl-CoA dehydrogenase family protein [Dehalococcoidales bacterium]|nr:acyl-CoA dehydrogenase family protein [Dehalococcoidales bacterium]
MDFDLTEEQKMLRGTLRDFADAEVAPAAARIDATEEFPAAELKKIAGLGLFGLTIPEKYGGSGRGLVDLCLAIEELARASAAVDAYLRISLSLAIVPVIGYGTEAQKKKHLPPHASGEKMACFALTEAGAGSDPAGLETTATRRQGGYVINGTKLFITNGDRAGTVVVFATVDKSLRQRGITAFVMDRDTPGLSVGKHENKMGLRGLSSVELIFQDCYLPEGNRLGGEGQGLRIALDALDVSRVTVGAEAVGISRAAFEAALKYAKERRQFGQPIAGFQAIQWMLADMATQIDAARLLTWRAAFLADRPRPYIKEAAMAKVFASEVAGFVTGKALQIHGGYGYMKDYPVERYFRDAKITEIYEGTSEIMRMTIARSLLKEE